MDVARTGPVRAPGQARSELSNFFEQRYIIATSHKRLCHTDHRPLHGRFSVMEAGLLCDVRRELGNSDLSVLQLAFLASEQALALRRLEPVDGGRNGALYIVVAEVDEVLVHE